MINRTVTVFGEIIQKVWREFGFWVFSQKFRDRLHLRVLRRLVT